MYGRAASETHRPSDQQTPAGAMDAGLFWFLVFIPGTGRSPSPKGAAAMGATPSGAPLWSCVADGNGDEAGRLSRLHPHQYGTFAAGLRVGHRLAHLGRGRDRLAVDVEDDVPGLEAVAGRAVGIDRSHHDAFAPAFRRCERQAESRHLGGLIIP